MIDNQEAFEFAKSHKQEFIDCAIGRAVKDKRPVAIFMAGTPGAGKTEIAKSIMSLFSPTIARIDPDDFRSLFPGYNGTNSSDFQGPSAMMVDKVLEYILGEHNHKPKYSFVLDGTFAFKNAVMNIKRSLTRGFDVQIYFIYQSPTESWRFTKEREKKEGRSVPKETFINAYFVSKQNVLKVKQQFGDDVSLHVIIKDYKKDTEEIHYNVDNLEKLLPKPYNEDELNRILSTDA